MVRMSNADATADALLKAVRMDGVDAPCPRLIAKRFGVAVFSAPKSARWSEIGERVIVNGEERIYVRTGLDDARRNHVVAHELGHVVLSRWCVRVEDSEIEPWCNRFGAALLAPSAAVWRAWRACGGRAADVVTRWAHVPPTCIALRLGEARCADLWITQGKTIRYARAESIAPLGVVATGADAARNGASAGYGLHALRLADMPRRAVVLADAA